MKQFLFACLLVFVLALDWSARGQAIQFVNNGVTNCPPSPIPNIDALTFINNGQFNIFLNNLAGGSFLESGFFGVNSAEPPFDFSDVLVYTNRGLLTSDAGFFFNTQPSGDGIAHRASSFGNANIGYISAGSASNGLSVNLIFFIIIGDVTNEIGGGLSSYPTLSVSATNIYNFGTLDVGQNGLILLDGANIDLTRGKLVVENQQGNTSQGQGIFTTYWGVGKETNDLQNLPLIPPDEVFGPFVNVTNKMAQPDFQELAPQDAIAAANTNALDTNNIYTDIVIVGNTNALITNEIMFETNESAFLGADVPVVAWIAVVTNSVGTVVSNALFLEDLFGVETNLQTSFNVGQSTISPVQEPVNYNFSTAFPGFGFLSPGNTIYDPSLIPTDGITNSYSAYGVQMAPMTYQPDPLVFGQTYSNSPGRVQINADNSLDLSRVKILGPNYLQINATNGYKGSASAQIAVPFSDFTLGAPSGTLVISNLIAPNIPGFTGTIGLYSARWNNVNMGVTNHFHLLLVDSQLSPFMTPQVENISLTATNVIINDNVSVLSNFFINATKITIASNAPGFGNPYGTLNIYGPNILWQASLPTLQYLTNFGLINVSNTAYFAQVGAPPFYVSDFTNSYKALVNHGTIMSAGDVTWADYFENTGVGVQIPSPLSGSNVLTSTNNLGLAVIGSVSGPITIQASNAVLGNGLMATLFGDISLMAGSLSISNHALISSGTINLTPTNSLTDRGATGNFWSVNDGINLLRKPTLGDLLGTTVSNYSDGFETSDTWAGRNFGPVTAGFNNNAALGHMILNGLDTDVLFDFNGPDTNTYAMYVDLLELQGPLTNGIAFGATNGSGSFLDMLNIADNVTIYYAGAVTSNSDVSLAINGANNGHLVWVPTYAGIFSGTNVVTGGVTNFVNRAAYVGFGTNATITASSINLKIALTNLPPIFPVISWNAFADTTNTLYYQSNLMSSSKVVITNFVQPGTPYPSGRVTVTDTNNHAGSVGFYRVLEQP